MYNHKGKLQVEVMCNLDQVPAAGAIVIAAFLRIEGATGLPVREWAITEERAHSRQIEEGKGWGI